MKYGCGPIRAETVDNYDHLDGHKSLLNYTLISTRPFTPKALCSHSSYVVRDEQKLFLNFF